MGLQILKQSNGRYAIFSSVVDDFVALNYTSQEVIKAFVSREKARIIADVEKILHELDKGGKPYYQFTHSMQECINIVERSHGKEAETLKYIRRKKITGG